MMTGSFFDILEKESVEPHTPLNFPMRRYIIVIGGGVLSGNVFVRFRCHRGSIGVLRRHFGVQTLPEGYDIRRWLNHLFQHCVTSEVSEYKNIEETFSPEVISRMISWLKAL